MAIPSPPAAGRPPAAIGLVNREAVHRRACELAVIAGRVHALVTQKDYEQAKRELTGVADADRQMAIIDAAPRFRGNEAEPDPLATRGVDPLPARLMRPSVPVRGSQ